MPGYGVGAGQAGKQIQVDDGAGSTRVKINDAVKNMADAIYGFVNKNRGGTPGTKYYGSSSGGGGDYGGGSYDHIDTGEIERRLREEEENRKKQLAEWYEQEKTTNRNNYERTRNNMNSQYLTAERRLRNLYGNQITGKGLASRARNYSMWQNNTSNAMQDYMNNDSASLQKYNQNLADVARMNAQGWYNYVYPLWMQQYKYDQEMNFRKWMQQL